MSDNNAGEESKDSTTEGEEKDTKTSDEKKEGGEGADDSGASDKGSKGEGDDKKSDDTKKDDKKESDKEDDDGEDEPPTRSKSKIDFINERKAAKLDKLKDKDKGKDGGGEGDDEGGEDDAGKDADGDDEVDPEDRKVISKEIDKRLQPFLEKQHEAETKADVSGFVAKNPDFQPFEAKILKYALHPSRKNLPIESIAYEVAGPKLLQLGAERGKKADKEAKEHQAGGGSSKDSGEGKMDVWSMSVEDFEKKKTEILARRRD